MTWHSPRRPRCRARGSAALSGRGSPGDRSVIPHLHRRGLGLERVSPPPRSGCARRVDAARRARPASGVRRRDQRIGVPKAVRSDAHTRSAGSGGDRGLCSAGPRAASSRPSRCSSAPLMAAPPRAAGRLADCSPPGPAKTRCGGSAQARAAARTERTVPSQAMPRARFCSVLIRSPSRLEKAVPRSSSRPPSPDPPPRVARHRTRSHRPATLAERRGWQGTHRRS